MNTEQHRGDVIAFTPRSDTCGGCGAFIGTVAAQSRLPGS
jgi:hypothetical protein